MPIVEKISNYIKRSSKFKKPASSDIKEKASINDEIANKFREQFDKKGRATISVSVGIMDQDGFIAMVGNYDWFV